jgi:hypothetical protein
MELITKFTYNTHTGIFIGKELAMAIGDNNVKSIVVTYNGAEIFPISSTEGDFSILREGYFFLNPRKFSDLEDGVVFIKITTNTNAVTLRPIKEIDIEGSNVNHPSHYNTGKFEVIDVIHDWGIGFDLGNAVKYIARAGHKDESKYIEDLKKAIFYINDEIKRHSEKNGGQNAL